MILSDEKLRSLEQLVRDCGNYMKSAMITERDPYCVRTKSGDADFVTIYDESVQGRLIEGISDLFPDSRFFAEEKSNSEEDTKTGLCFVIDPIDGTTNFIHNLRASAISVALLVEGIPEFGLIYDPYNDEIYSAKRGSGAYCNGKSIHVSARKLSEAVISFGTSPYNKTELAERGFEIAKKIFMNCADIRRSGSAALDMVNVACGKLDGFFECLLSPWDYAAGSLIVREAGGSVTDFNGNNVSFSCPSAVLCSNNSVKDAILTVINN